MGRDGAILGDADAIGVERLDAEAGFAGVGIAAEELDGDGRRRGREVTALDKAVADVPPEILLDHRVLEVVKRPGMVKNPGGVLRGSMLDLRPADFLALLGPEAVLDRGAESVLGVGRRAELVGIEEDVANLLLGVVGISGVLRLEVDLDQAITVGIEQCGVNPCFRTSGRVNSLLLDLPGQSASCTTASSASPWPTTRLRWPLPVVSSPSVTPPGPKRRASPSLASISTSPAK